jgi:DNA repair exonuclease SbcCD nuclease subunit
MKIALINDTHFGVKNSSELFLNYQFRFFNELFFPYCRENGIKKIIHLGDFYEHRKYVGIRTLNRVREDFIKQLSDLGMTMDIIPGNHDVFYKNTNALNALEESLAFYGDMIRLVMQPTEIEYDGLRFAMLPWISTESMKKSLAFIKDVSAPIMLAHLELQGFEMMKGAPVISHGLSASLFNKFESVFTGHYHTKSTQGNIHYLGTQYELTWADADDPKFFHIFDTQTRELLPVRNSIRMFHKIFYDDNPKQSIPDIKNAFVKIFITSKKDESKFDSFLRKINKGEPFDVKLIESYDGFSGSAIDDENISLEDTGSLLSSYVDAIDTSLDKERIKTVLHELYVEAQSLDVL